MTTETHEFPFALRAPKEGMVMVPVEPTPEMMQAGVVADCLRRTNHENVYMELLRLDAVYKAMLAAAPKTDAGTVVPAGPKGANGVVVPCGPQGPNGTRETTDAELAAGSNAIPGSIVDAYRRAPYKCGCANGCASASCDKR